MNVAKIINQLNWTENASSNNARLINQNLKITRECINDACRAVGEPNIRANQLSENVE